MGSCYARRKLAMGSNFHFVFLVLSLANLLLMVVLISSIWLGSTASLLQMTVIGVIVWLSFYENCYY